MSTTSDRSLFNAKIAPASDSATDVTSSSSASSKRVGDSEKKKKLGWTRIQRKTVTIISKIQEEKKKHPNSVSIMERLKAANLRKKGDRSHRITEQIDAIRAEQIQRLNAKEEKKKEILDDKKKKSLCSISMLKKIVIHPKSVWKQVWDITILLLVVFSSVQIPLLLAFPDMKPLEQVMQVSIDVIFIIDFGFCFRTGFLRPDNEVEMNQVKIVSQYLKSWFAIDFAACFRK